MKSNKYKDEKIIIPHGDKSFTLVHPGKGPNTYEKVGQEILSKGESLQSGYETSSFLVYFSNLDKSEKEEIQSHVNWFWAYNTNFWLPEDISKSGMYSIRDPKALGTNMKFDQEQLEEMLKESENYHGVRFNSEKGISFAPRYTIYLGVEKNWDNFAINGLNIALFSPKGAENLAKLGKERFDQGYTDGVKGNNQLETRVSGLYGSGKGRNMIFVSASYDSEFYGGTSFGKPSKK